MRPSKAHLATSAAVAFLLAASAPVLAQSGTPADARPVQDLQHAAQQLRDATHDLVREQASAKRNEIIQRIDKTLVDVQAAIVSLPPNLMLAGTNEAESKKASSTLANAADRLEQSAQALSTDTSPDKRSQTMQEIRHALAQIQTERLAVSGGVSTTTGSAASAPAAGSPASAPTPGSAPR